MRILWSHTIPERASPQYQLCHHQYLQPCCRWLLNIYSRSDGCRNRFKIMYTSLAFACSAESRTARFYFRNGRWDANHHPQWWWNKRLPVSIILINPRIIISAAWKSAITPSLSGGWSWCCRGFSCICMASRPECQHFSALFVQRDDRGFIYHHFVFCGWWVCWLCRGLSLYLAWKIEERHA